MFNDPLLQRFFPQPAADPRVDRLMDMIIALGNELIGARVRMRALLSVLEEKGILLPEEFDVRAQQTWESDYDELAQEMYETLRSREPPASPLSEEEASGLSE